MAAENIRRSQVGVGPGQMILSKLTARVEGPLIRVCVESFFHRTNGASLSQELSEEYNKRKDKTYSRSFCKQVFNLQNISTVRKVTFKRTSHCFLSMSSGCVTKVFLVHKLLNRS